jgi:hypothetical protein
VASNGNLPPLDVWRPESFRFTAFPTDIVPSEQVSWWDALVSVPAETVVSRPKAAQYEAQGEFEGRRLSLQIQPGRIEWNLKPIVKAVTPDEQFNVAMLGTFSEALASLSRIVSSWLPQAPALNRLAFGAIAFQPVDTGSMGNILIQKYLPGLSIDPEGSSDLFYQINRPRSSTNVSGLRFNRLSKWSVQVAQRINLVLGGPSAVQRTIDFEAACKLEVDINTFPDFGASLPPGLLTTLLQEMSALGCEIAQKGDVR